ncbi:NAD(P)/FAD-dependent oxidoreductase [Desulfosediminicola flagellatus]|uniref:FAD/NAD(P)-dependent oxidoreductase n=1 Tax=Desulfosediminicola flagellatus TaxID=2569541 RepID=UPI0010ABB19B|nr:NAD(P)/FAD-dependent oxidoreductase [Desulfosediminicola flagellatus]
MDVQTDLLVVGAGPAGLAAACAARSCGLEVTVVDEQAAPGGQLFRNIETPLGQSMLEPKEREQGMNLAADFRKSGVKYYPGTTVWGLEPRKVSCNINGKPVILKPSTTVIAPGAMERPVPFPGWTLPGVLGAGAGDIILRSGGTLTENPDDPVVLAGNGPLLLLLACHLIHSGVKVAAWLDTGYWSRRLMAAPLMPASLLDSPYLGKGLGMALQIVKGKIPIVSGVKNIRAVGKDRLEKVVYEVLGKQKELYTGTLMRHEGVIPRTHILNSMKVEHAWDSVQRYWYPVVSECGATSIDGIYLAGDAGYVHGGDASILKGRLSGIDAARSLGVISDSEARFRSAEPLAVLRRMRIARGFLRYVFAPNPGIFDVSDDTMVCRCECVTAGDIRRAVREGHTDVNEVKLYTRCGMGQCQGRMCGPALAEITAAEVSRSPKKVGTLKIQQPFRPVALRSYCDVNSLK